MNYIRKNILLLIIATLFAITIVYGYGIVKSHNKAVGRFKKEIKILKEEVSFTDGLLRIRTKFNKPIVLSQNFELENGKQIGLMQTGCFGKRSVLVFKFSKNNCQSCVDAEIRKLRLLKEQVNKDQIVIFASVDLARELTLYRKLYNLDLLMYKVDEEYNSLNDIEKLNLPYYYIIEKDLSTSSLFIPEKTKGTLTDTYYKEVVSRLNN